MQTFEEIIQEQAQLLLKTSGIDAAIISYYDISTKRQNDLVLALIKEDAALHNIIVSKINKALRKEYKEISKEAIESDPTISPIVKAGMIANLQSAIR